MSPDKFRVPDFQADERAPEWDERFASTGDNRPAGDRYERLAAELRAARPQPPAASETFKRELRARLIAGATEKRAPAPFWQYAFNLGGLALVALILFLAITQIPNSLPLAQLDPLPSPQLTAPAATATARLIVAGATVGEPQWLLFTQNTQSLFGPSATTTGGWQGVENVFVAHLDGKNLRPVLDGPEAVNWLVDVAPNGQRILLAAGDSSAVDAQPVSLYAVEVSGGKPVLISAAYLPSSEGEGAFWLADGERLILIAEDAQGPGVFLARRDGGELLRLSPPGLQPTALFRSRNSAEGGFWRQAASETASTQAVVRGPLWWSALDGFGTLPALSELPVGFAPAGLELAVAPDGETVAFSRSDCLAVLAVRTANLSPSCRTLYFSDRHGKDITRQVFSGWPRPIAWARDGVDLAVAVSAPSAGARDSYEVSLAIWKPDGEPLFLPAPQLRLQQLSAQDGLQPLEELQSLDRLRLEWAADGLNLIVEHPGLDLPTVVNLQSLEVFDALPRAATWPNAGRPSRIFWGPATEPEWKIEWFAPDRAPYPPPPGVSPDDLAPAPMPEPYPYPYPAPAE